MKFFSKDIKIALISIAASAIITFFATYATVKSQYDLTTVPIRMQMYQDYKVLNYKYYNTLIQSEPKKDDAKILFNKMIDKDITISTLSTKNVKASSRRLLEKARELYDSKGSEDFSLALEKYKTELSLFNAAICLELNLPCKEEADGQYQACHMKNVLLDNN